MRYFSFEFDQKIIHILISSYGTTKTLTVPALTKYDLPIQFNTGEKAAEPWIRSKVTR